MDTITENQLKSNPVLWAKWESANNGRFWRDSQKNATGLFKKLCDFVITEGAPGR